MAFYFTQSGTPSPPLTLPQAESPTDTTQGTLDGAILNAAILNDLAPKQYNPVITAGMTLFTLPSAPQNPASIRFEVNGTEYISPDISISGLIITWNNLSFVIGANDQVHITYL